MVSDGIVHGLVVGEGLPLHYPAVAAKGKEKSGGAYAFNSRGVGLVARFANGRPVGKVWLGMVGDAQASQPGFLYGEPRIGPGDTLNMTGDAVRCNRRLLCTMQTPQKYCRTIYLNAKKYLNAIKII